MADDDRKEPLSARPPQLCYRDQSISLPEGELYLGRDPTCAIVIDDPLSSRRHAKLTVRATLVTLEDLESRNGVFVNGVEIVAPYALTHGDRITIGGQELLFRWATGAPHSAVGRVHLSQMMRAATGAPPKDALESPAFPSTMDLDPDRFAAATLGREDLHGRARLEAFRVLAGLANRALAEAKPDVAEHVLERALAEIISSARCGVGIDPELAQFAGRYAARLARATNKAFWIDYLFDLFGLLGLLLPRDVVDELAECVRSAGPIDMSTVRTYMTKARSVAATKGVGELSLLYKSEELVTLIERAR